MKKSIIINDSIYGRQIITEPVLVELLKSNSIQRLKKICQFGIPDEYYHLKNFYRYEHSVGVMILIGRLGGTVEEQAAGLLHDVSHTAFSHVIDWVVGEAGNETYQDTRHEDIINSKEISGILKKYKYSPRRIADYHNFKLLEREIPDLCADRLDYSLREFPVALAKRLSNHLVNSGGRIVFQNHKDARIFATNFLKLQKKHWGGFEAVSRFRLFSVALKLAIKDGTISLSDFQKDDRWVVGKLKKTKNSQVVALLNILKNKKMPRRAKTETVNKKFRYTNPEFLNDGRVIRLSDADPMFKIYLKKQEADNRKGIKVPVF